MTDTELLEQFKMLYQGVETMVGASEQRMKVYIENTVTKRIDTLFDGYKLTHEKQWEMERRTELLGQQLEDLQARLTILESKSA